MEDKENSNPIVATPSEDVAVREHKDAGNLMQFNSPDEQNEPKAAEELLTTTSSPKRPVLTEIKVDLFGLISPDQKSNAKKEEGEEEEKEGSLKNVKASDLLSMSIFQTSPSAKDNNQQLDTSTQSSHDDSSFISTHLLFNQSLNLSLNRSQTCNESSNDSNSTINKTMQLSVIDSSTLLKNEMEFSVTYDNFESEAKDCDQETSIDVDKCTSFVASSSTSEQQQVNNDNVDSGASSLKDEDHTVNDVQPAQDSSLLETKLIYESQIVELNARIDELEEELHNKASQSAELDDATQAITETPFSMGDSVNLIKTKNDYESIIESLNERIQQLLEENRANQLKFEEATLKESNAELQTSMVPSDSEMTFSLEDRVNLLETKVAYEKQIVDQEEKIDTMGSEIDSLKSRIGQQDAHYVRLVSELESTIADLRGRLSENHEKYELSLVPKYESLKSQFQELTMKQLESEGANQQLLENITDMDEQRNALRGKLEQANEQLALKAEQLEEVRGQLAQAQQQLKSKEETLLPQIEQLEMANRILSDDLSIRDSKCAELQAANDQLKKTLEEAISAAQVDQVTAMEAKKVLEEQLTVSDCLAKKLQESLCAEQQARDTLLLPAKEKLLESVDKFTKMSASITKLITVMKTGSSYKETVPSDIVKKILYNVRYKVNCTVVESSQVLGLPCDIVLPPAVAGGSHKATEEEGEEVNLSEDVNPVVEKSDADE